MAGATQTKEMTAFLESFSKLKANWHLEESRADSIVSEYFRVWRDVGAIRFGRGVHKMLHESNLRFFPTLAEFRGYVPASEKRVYCGHCNEGFISVVDEEAQKLYGGDRRMAMPCDCTGGIERLRRLEAANPTWKEPKYERE